MKKLSLKELKVKSFVTDDLSIKSKTIKGGAHTETLLGWECIGEVDPRGGYSNANYNCWQPSLYFDPNLCGEVTYGAPQDTCLEMCQ
jgi:hypothetical protein